MNQQANRAVRARYTLIFAIMIVLVFLFSQILDHVFYDYTVIETEIVFIKKISKNRTI